MKKAAAAGIILFRPVFFGVMRGDLPDSLNDLTARADKIQFLDRAGEPLNASYRNYWNVADVMPLHEMPPLLVNLFVAAESFFIFLLFLLERKSKNRNQISLDELNSITSALRKSACSCVRAFGLYSTFLVSAWKM